MKTIRDNLKESKSQKERRELKEAIKGLRNAVYTALAIEKIAKWINDKLYTKNK